jgi:hypothetical protein
MKDEGNGHLEAVGSREKFDDVTAVCVSIRAGSETRCGLDWRVRRNYFSPSSGYSSYNLQKGGVGFSGNGGSCLLGYIFVFQINNNINNKCLSLQCIINIDIIVCYIHTLCAVFYLREIMLLDLCSGADKSLAPSGRKHQTKYNGK